MPRLKAKYRDEVAPALMQDLGYTSVMAIPTVKKIVLNIGLGEALTNPRALDAAVGDLAIDSGQKPVVTKAKRSIAQFKIREGMPHRSDGDAPRRPHVGVSRPFHQRLHFRASVTSRAFPIEDSTAAATTASACASSSFSRRSTTTRSIGFADCKSQS